jgi:hypothetical protein
MGFMCVRRAILGNSTIHAPTSTTKLKKSGLPHQHRLHVFKNTKRGWQSPQHEMHPLVILTSVIIQRFPCIVAPYFCFLDLCAKSLSSLLLSFLLLLAALSKKKKCRRRFKKILKMREGSLKIREGSEMLSDRCKSHDFRSLAMST